MRAARYLPWGPRETCGLPQVVFDSFLQPVVCGMRSAGAGARRMVYNVDPFLIDLQIELGSDKRTLVITGQLVDSRRQESSARDVLVVVSNLRGEVVFATTDKFGEFRKEIADTGDLELLFLGLSDHPFTIALGNPLRRSVE